MVAGVGWNPYPVSLSCILYLCSKKHALGAPRLIKPRSPTNCMLEGVKPSSFFKPLEACIFLRFRLRFKTTQARALWEKIRGEREKGIHTYIIQFWIETLI